MVMHFYRQRTAYLAVLAITCVVLANVVNQVGLAAAGLALFIVMLIDYERRYRVFGWSDFVSFPLGAAIVAGGYWLLGAPMSFYVVPLLMVGACLSALSKRHG